MGRTRTSWKRGQSGNPRGRPKREETLTDMIRDVLREPVSIDDDGAPITKARRLAELVVSAALGGTEWAVKLVADRTEGRAPTYGELQIEARLADLEHRLAERDGVTRHGTIRRTS